MTADEALRDIRGFTAAGRVILTRHARQRMRQRGMRAGDVEHAMANATECRAAEEGRWRASGPDLDGDELTAVVAIADGVIVVTVF